VFLGALSGFIALLDFRKISYIFNIPSLLNQAAATNAHYSLKFLAGLFPLLSIRLLKKWFFTGWSKIFRCKAREITRNEAYFLVRRNDEG